MNIELTKLEKNVLLVALDHMEDHIMDLTARIKEINEELNMEERELRDDIWKKRLDACKTIRTKI